MLALLFIWLITYSAASDILPTTVVAALATTTTVVLAVEMSAFVVAATHPVMINHWAVQYVLGGCSSILAPLLLRHLSQLLRHCFQD